MGDRQLTLSCQDTQLAHGEVEARLGVWSSIAESLELLPEQ